MKKIFLILWALILLTSCGYKNKKEDETINRYTYYLNLLNAQKTFKESSDYFDTTLEIKTIDGVNHYYITIENPRIAMSSIKAIAIIKGEDYNSQMAFTSGVFDTSLSMIPGQVKLDSNYVKGIVMSATSNKKTDSIYLLVQFNSLDQTKSYSEYLLVKENVSE